MDEPRNNLEKAKRYQKIRQRLTLINLGFAPLVLLIMVMTPLSLLFWEWASAMVTAAYLRVPVYYLFFSIFMLLADLPLSFYSGFVLEHRFDLSNQNLTGWAKDALKRFVLGLVLALPLITGLYALIRHCPQTWWIWAWAAYAAVAFVLGKIFPVFIVPLFYKYGKVQDTALEGRIRALTTRYGLAVSNVYSLNLSKTTKKANAAFMGLGRTKRVVLSDTLLAAFTPDEIEIVMAHELGHFVHRDVWKQLGVGMAGSLAAFWLAFRLMTPVTGAFGFDGAGDVAALPLLFLVFYGFNLVLMPLQSGFSRRMEYAADRFAIRAFERVDVFAACMNKLAQVNLSDPEPNPVYEWFFYDHPSIARRIRAVSGLKPAVPAGAP